MAELFTPWGYSVTVEGKALPPLISADKFREAGGSELSAQDTKVMAALAAASSTVRDFCGWHVAPLLPCSCELDGGARILWLPCMGVRSVGSVAVRGEKIEDYEWASRGELKLGHPAAPGMRAVAVRFEAGYATEATQAVAQVVVQVVTNALVASPGLREEHSGSVGATYNQTANGVSGGVRLLESDMVALAPYRIVSA